MRDITIEYDPVCEIPYQLSGPGNTPMHNTLQVFRAYTRFVKGPLRALVLAGDLQGNALDDRPNGPSVLLGELLAETLEFHGATGVLPPPSETGVILTGDLFSAVHGGGRGVSGDVRGVWESFRTRFRWVAGVPGNHDRFGTSKEFEEFRERDRLYYLDGAQVLLDQLRIGGVGGVTGKPTKPFRRTRDDFLGEVENVLTTGVDLLVTHEGPDFPSERFRGNPALRELLEQSDPVICVFGHCYWRSTPQVLSNGTELLNVDSRVIVLTRADDV